MTPNEIFVTALVILLIYTLYYLAIGRFKWLESTGLPYPKPVLFLGNLPEFFRYAGRGEIHQFFHDYLSKFGDVFAMNFNGGKTIITTDVDIIKEVFMNQFDKFHDRDVMAQFPSPFDRMLVVARGAHWKFLRSKMSPTFSSGKLKGMLDIMTECTNDAVGKMDRKIQDNNEVEFHKFSQELTMNIVLATAFGISNEMDQASYEDVLKRAKKSFEAPPSEGLLFLLPFGEQIVKHLPWGVKKRMNGIAMVARNIMETRRKTGESSRKDFLQLLLDAQTELGRENTELTDDDVMVQSVLFLQAGLDTTSSAVTVTGYYLARYPEWQEKIQNEIDNVINANDSKSLYDQLNQLPLLKMFVDEVLRLYPPGYLALRGCNEDARIKGINIKKGMVVIMSIYSLHRSEKYWKDPDVFDPERFSSEEKNNFNPMAYLPFGAGPRNCIGLRFALLQIKLVMVCLLKKFTFVLPDENKVLKTKSDFTLTPAGPVVLAMKPRQI